MNLKEEIANIIAEEIKNHKCDWDKFKTFLKYSILSNGRVEIFVGDFTYDKPNRIEKQVYGTYTDMDLNTTILKD